MENEKDYTPTELELMNFNTGYNSAIDTAEKIISDYIKQMPNIKASSEGHVKNIKIFIGMLRLIGQSK